MAMAEQQHAIRFDNGFAELLEEAVVQWSFLASHISVMTMGESLVAPPQTMGLKRCGVDLIALQPPQACAAVIEMDHQSFGLIAAAMGFRRLGMLGCDPSAF